MSISNQLSTQRAIDRPGKEPDECDKKLLINVAVFAELAVQQPGRELDHLVRCLYDKLREKFVLYSFVSNKKYNWDEGFSAFIAESAFADAVLHFREDLLKRDWYNGGASVQTYFLRVCRYKLLELKKKEERFADKARKYAIGVKEFLLPAHNDTDEEIKYERMEKALLQLDEDARKIINMRHREGKKVAEIASQLNWESQRVSDIIYKGMLKLRKIINKMEDPNVD